MIAVSGFSRSGTTVLRDVLNTHPQVKVLYEASVLERVPAPRSSYISALTIKEQNRQDLTRLVNHLWTKPIDPVTFPELEAAMKEVFGVAQVGDKLSSYFWSFSRHGAAGVKRIYIYRDPRDACASYWKCANTVWANMAWAKVSSVREVAGRWLDSVRCAEKSSGVHCVRYEELVSSPDLVLSGVAEFLGISPEFDSSVVHRKAEGRATLTPAQVAEIAEVAGPAMRRLGY